MAGLSSTTTAVGAPLTAYGTISNANGQALPGGNDSGAWGTSAIGFTKWAFQLLGNITAVSITLYGTLDPNAYLVYTANAANDGSVTGSQYVAGTMIKAAVAIPVSNWFVLPAPAEQGGTGGVANPLVAGTTSLLICSLPLVAVRAVVTAAVTPTGTGSVVAFAVP